MSHAPHPYMQRDALEFVPRAQEHENRTTFSRVCQGTRFKASSRALPVESTMGPQDDKAQHTHEARGGPCRKVVQKRRLDTKTGG